MRVGVLGSAFNPPHLGHLVCAQEAMVGLGLDRVVLVPVGEAPHKAIVPEPGREARFEMTRLAAARDPGLEVSRVEVDRPGPSYTCETLELLAARDRELTFILGADQAASLASWHRPEDVVARARLGIAGRAGASESEVRTALETVGATGRADWFRMPEIGVSSSMVRERISRRLPIRYLVPDDVIDYIDDKELYL